MRIIHSFCCLSTPGSLKRHFRTFWRKRSSLISWRKERGVGGSGRRGWRSGTMEWCGKGEYENEVFWMRTENHFPIEELPLLYRHFGRETKCDKQIAYLPLPNWPLELKRYGAWRTKPLLALVRGVDRFQEINDISYLTSSRPAGTPR